MLTITYPRLFISEMEGEGKMDSQGDQIIAGLFHQEVAAQVDIRAMNYRLAVMDCGLRLFGDYFDAWLKKQFYLPDMAGVNQAFLRDTLKFIHTGEREMHALTWRDIMGERGNSPAVASYQRVPDLEIGKLSTPTAIQLWCSHPNGVADLLNSLYTIFGPSKDVPA